MFAFITALLNFIFYLPFGGEKTFRRKCASYIRPNDIRNILDVCCNDGQMFPYLREIAGEEVFITGLDSDGDRLRLLSDKIAGSPASLVYAYAERLPFRESSFDCVFICLGMHHIPAALRKEVLHEVRRVVKSGGQLVVVDYHLPKIPLLRQYWQLLVKSSEDEDAYTMMMRDELPADMRAAGFSISRRGCLGYGTIQVIQALPEH